MAVIDLSRYVSLYMYRVSITEPPDEPSGVRLHVTGASSLLVRYEEPHHHNGAVVTQYKGMYTTNMYRDKIIARFPFAIAS